MYERIIEIMVVLLSEITAQDELNNIDFDKLNSLGYTNEEISTAFSWLLDKLDSIKRPAKNESVISETGFRILSKPEQDLFTKDTWGEIINLQSFGILSNESLEGLIDWAMYVGIEKVEKTHLHNYLAYSLFNLPNQTPDGSRYMLFGNDTIN